MMFRNRSADVHSQHAWAANVDAARTNQKIPGLQLSTNRIPAMQHSACITDVPVLDILGNVLVVQTTRQSANIKMSM